MANDTDNQVTGPGVDAAAETTSGAVSSDKKAKGVQRIKNAVEEEIGAGLHVRFSKGANENYLVETRDGTVKATITKAELGSFLADLLEKNL